MTLLTGDTPAATATLPPHTAGTLLAGRVRYAQFADGYRTGLEPVLMAAAIPARPGQTVLEAGCGAGAGLMCLATRIPAIGGGTGIERDAATHALARQNIRDNGLGMLQVECADITAWAAPGQPAPRFDHAFANPPWHRGTATLAPDPRRRAARSEDAGNTLECWVKALAAQVRHAGSVTLALPAASLARAITALSTHRVGSIAVMPLWPHVGEAARLVLVQGRKGGRGDTRLLPGLVLHEADGRLTDALQAILRDGAAMPL